MHPPPPPDGPGSPGGTGPGGDLPEDDQHKAKLDDTELNVGSPRAMQKVELDLDDAPFLEDEPPPPPPVEEVPTAPPPQELDVPVKIPFWKKKIVLIGAAAWLLVVIIVAAWWFFLRTVKQDPVEPDVTPPPTVPAPPPPPAEPPPPPPPPDVFLPMEPFVVEKTDPKGVTRVLSLTIKLVYKEDPRLATELSTKRFALRDGLYYNLKNKTFASLTDQESVEQLREELRSVANNYLNTGTVDQVLFEELLVK